MSRLENELAALMHQSNDLNADIYYGKRLLKDPKQKSLDISERYIVGQILREDDMLVRFVEPRIDDLESKSKKGR